MHVVGNDSCAQAESFPTSVTVHEGLLLLQHEAAVVK